MDFSAWNWATSFRVHEAACLIAGVMPISKRYPTSEELPPQARPILVKLLSAYVEWILQTTNPSRPKSTVLEGYLNDDGTVPEISSLAELPGALVSRKAINRFLSEMAQEHGYKSAYDFDPIGKTGAQQIEPTPVELPLDDAPTPAEPLPNPTTTRKKRITWLDVAGPYITGVMQDGQCATAKELFRVLGERAGPDSPFDKGQGGNRGSLFVREIGQPVALKTLQNHFSKLREKARNTAP